MSEEAHPEINIARWREARKNALKAAGAQTLDEQLLNKLYRDIEHQLSGGEPRIIFTIPQSLSQEKALEVLKLMSDRFKCCDLRQKGVMFWDPVNREAPHVDAGETTFRLELKADGGNDE